MKLCIDGIFFMLIEKVENQEILYCRSFKECFGEFKRQSENFGEKIRLCEFFLDILDFISLIFYRKNIVWNVIF